MKTEKVTLLSTVLAVSLGLVLSFAPAPAKAHCKGNHTGGHPHCLVDEGGTLNVTVAFRDDDSDGLTSDKLGLYTHKEDKVSAGIGTNSGNFFMKLTKGNQLANRRLFLDFSECTSGSGTCTPPFESNSSVAGFTVAGANVFTSGVDLRRDMDVNASIPLMLRVAFNLSSNEDGLWILFLEGIKNADCPLSSSTPTVTRTSESWIIESAGVACLLRIDTDGAPGFSGLYRMPFEITVTEEK